MDLRKICCRCVWEGRYQKSTTLRTWLISRASQRPPSAVDLLCGLTSKSPNLTVSLGTLCLSVCLSHVWFSFSLTSFIVLRQPLWGVMCSAKAYFINWLLKYAFVRPSCKGTMKGGRRQGRQRKRWEANIREWTGLEFSKSQRAVENREKWRKLVAKSSVVPQWPWQLRDRWDERNMLL